MIVHQIYWDFSGEGKVMSDLYAVKQYEVMNWAKSNGYQYKIWNELMVDSLINNKYPQFKTMISNVRFTIMKVDIVKWLILHDEGGLYLDLDIEPNIDCLKPYNFALASSAPNKYNVDVIQSYKGNIMLLNFVEYIQNQIKQKDQISVYRVRKFRYVLQTTGPHALNRFIKVNKLKPNIYKTNDATTNPSAMNLKGDEAFLDHPSALWSKAI